VYLVVCDAGPLIHLDELNALSLLAVYAAALVPARVWDEVRLHRPSALRRRKPKLVRTVLAGDPAPDVNHVFDKFKLDAGEREAIQLGIENPGAKLLSDDGAARDAAGLLGLPVQGSLGVILDALHDGRRSKRQVLHLLESIPARSTLFIKTDLLQAVIAQVQERR